MKHPEIDVVSTDLFIGNNLYCFFVIGRIAKRQINESIALETRLEGWMLSGNFIDKNVSKES